MSAPTAMKPAAPRFVLPVLAVGMFGAYLNYAVISPLLPAISLDFGVTEALAGQSATISLAVGFFVTLGLTPLVDRRPPRWWLILLASIMIISAIVSAWAPTFAWFIVGRILAGIGGSVLTANVYAAAREAYADPLRRTRALGVIASAASFAIIAGLPLITLLGARFGWRYGMLAVAVPFLILALGALAIPRPIGKPNPDPIGAIEAYRSVIFHREAMWLLLCFGAAMGAYNGWLVYFGAYAMASRGVSADVLSIVFLISGVAELIFSNVAPRLSERYGLAAVAIGGLILNCLPLFLSMLVQGPVLLTVAAAVFSVGSILAYVALYARVLGVEHAQPGALLAMVSAATGLGSALGPLIAGWIILVSGSYDLAYVAMGVILLIGVVGYRQADRAAA